MWVKICGVQSMRAAVAAVDAGADAVGFIFAPSRRQIGLDKAQAVVAGLPATAAKVGIFVNQEPDTINRIAEYVGLSHVQLHGDEPPHLLAAVNRPVIKAFRIQGPADLQGLLPFRQAAGLLLDPYVFGQYGGTGKSLDWTLVRWAAELLRKEGVDLAGPDEPLIPGRPKLILAGGLTPDNIEKALEQALPGGVDVSSGVETNGKKDMDKIYHFVELAKGASA